MHDFSQYSYFRLRSRFCASIFRGDLCSALPAGALYWRLLGRRGGDVNRAVAAAARELTAQDAIDLPALPSDPLIPIDRRPFDYSDLATG